VIKVGSTAPDFQTTDADGNTVRLSERLAAGDVLLYFYPADFTPICTAQACAFQERSEALNDVSVQILGISPQSAESHRRFAATYGLTFPLLSDESRDIIRAYGVEGPFGFGVRRATFIIGQDGTVKNRVVSDLFVGSHTDLIRSVLKAGSE
jgi:peroxiredoxin Q/BCP